jgi:hypothetical protein
MYRKVLLMVVILISSLLLTVYFPVNAGKSYNGIVEGVTEDSVYSGKVWSHTFYNPDPNYGNYGIAVTDIIFLYTAIQKNSMISTQTGSIFTCTVNWDMCYGCQAAPIIGITAPGSNEWVTTEHVYDVGPNDGQAWQVFYSSHEYLTTASRIYFKYALVPDPTPCFDPSQ